MKLAIALSVVLSFLSCLSLSLKCYKCIETNKNRWTQDTTASNDCRSSNPRDLKVETCTDSRQMCHYQKKYIKEKTVIERRGCEIPDGNNLVVIIMIIITINQVTLKVKIQFSLKAYLIFSSLS